MVKTAPKTSPGAAKLAALGVQLPTLPVSLPGSLPKQPELTELRFKVSRGVQQTSELERKEKLSTEVWIREQERAGVDVLCDGEMNRSDLVQYFAKKIDGFELSGTVRSYGNRYYKKPVIRSKVSWKEPMALEMWRYAQRMTHRPVKAVVTGPYTLMDWSFDDHYGSRDEACADLAAVIKKEVTTLVENGAKIIQIDEPSLSSRPEEFSMVVDALKEITGRHRAYFILHHCYGDLAPVWGRLAELPVDNLSLETTNSDFSILSLARKFPLEKDFTIGLIDSHSHDVETAREVADRLKKARAAIPASRLWLGPDCGLKTRTVDEAIGKIRALCLAVKKARSSK